MEERQMSQAAQSSPVESPVESAGLPGRHSAEDALLRERLAALGLEADDPEDDTARFLRDELEEPQATMSAGTRWEHAPRPSRRRPALIFVAVATATCLAAALFSTSGWRSWTKLWESGAAPTAPTAQTAPTANAVTEQSPAQTPPLSPQPAPQSLVLGSPASADGSTAATAPPSATPVQEEADSGQVPTEFIRQWLLNSLPASQSAGLLGSDGRWTETSQNPALRVFVSRLAAELTPEQLTSQFSNRPVAQAELLGAVGSACRRVGDYPSAISLLQRALSLYAKDQEAQRANLWRLQCELADAHYLAGEPAKAAAIWKQAQQEYAQTLGPDHDDTLTIVDRLASSYLADGKIDEAARLYEDELNRATAQQGREHPAAIRSLNNLAIVVGKQKQSDKSTALLQEALEISSRQLGDEHPATVLVRANLGAHYRESGKWEPAIALLEQVHKQRSDHSALHGVDSELLVAYVSSGKTAQALALVAEIVQASRATLPPKSPELAAALAANAIALLNLKAWGDAETALRECLAIREQTMSDSWLTFHAKSLLGAALLGQKQHAQAEPLLRDGYDGMVHHKSQIPAGGLIRLSEGAGRLASLYAAWDRLEEADKWRAKSVEHQAILAN